MKVKNYVQKIIITIEFKLVQSIEIEVTKTQDINRLNELSKMMPTSRTNNLIYINAAKSAINNKKQRLQQAQLVKKATINISEELKQIVVGITDGNLDIENARKIIEEEAKKQVESGSKNNFALTLSQQESSIISKINMYIYNNAKEYPIVNQDASLEVLSKLINEKSNALNVIVKNLIANEKYDEAINLCDKFKKENNYEAEPYFLRSIKMQIEEKRVLKQIIKKKYN